MTKTTYPVTPAVRALRNHNIPYEPHIYDYQERGGTKRSSASLGVNEHIIIKTLVMETDSGASLIVLMHGDCEVSTQSLARQLGAKRIAPCAPDKAQKLTGYMVGGTSPLGTRTELPVYAERTIFDLPLIYINGGKRGFLVSLAPRDLKRVLKIEEVEAAILKSAT
ncbi:MAG: Cys-tRNA(Pro) deacylase [Pyrinomonadaceae bacterium MAG19_C2-C3]|nr:Cys-tRNA(Pro) deacylase [Pyrinomonadaceae bacterium MAG19_C2-C3]